jgi:hypothetical protein
MPISPKSFNQIRDAGKSYGAAREALGIARAVVEAAPSEANQRVVDTAEAVADRALAGFLKALGAAEALPTAMKP